MVRSLFENYFIGFQKTVKSMTNLFNSLKFQQLSKSVLKQTDPYIYKHVQLLPLLDRARLWLSWPMKKTAPIKK